MEQRPLAEAYAAYAGHPAEGVVVTPGSNAAIRWVLGALRADAEVLVSPPCYYLYSLAAAWAGVRRVDVPLRAHDLTLDAQALLEAGRPPCAAVVTTPNNPTGRMPSAEALEQILCGFPGIVVADEAYAEFAGQTLVPRLADRPGLVVLRTMSKAFGVAGLRVGFLLADPALATEFRKLATPYAIDALAGEAACALLERPDVMRDRVARTVVERERMRAALDALPGVRTVPSDASFILVRLAEPMPDPATATAALAGAGVRVRDCSAMPLLEDALRVTVGRPHENDRVVQGLAALPR